MIPGICISSVDSLMNGSLIPFEEYMPLNLGERFSLCETGFVFISGLTQSRGCSRKISNQIRFVLCQEI
jgi:hypothetical protein